MLRSVTEGMWRGEDGRIRWYEAQTAPRRQESVSLTESREELVPGGGCAAVFDWIHGEWGLHVPQRVVGAPSP